MIALIVLFLRSGTTIRAAHTTSGIAGVPARAHGEVVRPGMGPP
jgi:hypothetical protein